MNAVDQGDVKYSIESGIATVAFHHPLSNSLPGKVLAKLADTITELGTNDDALVIVVRRACRWYRPFCSRACGRA